MKKFILSLLLFCGLVLPCFSSADTVSSLLDTHTISTVSPDTSNFSTTLINFGNVWQKIVCVWLHFEGAWVQIWFKTSNSATSVNDNPYMIWSDWDWKYVCLVKWSNVNYMGIKAYWSNYSVYWDYFYLNDLLNSDLPIMTSQDCQTQYSLIPISSVDQNYCITNFPLIPTSSVDQAYCINNFPVIAITWVNQDYCVNNNLCPVNTAWVSNVYINDIFHPWAFNVVINIPEEIDWDYAYTNSWYNLNLDVVWYNQDTEYINSLITTNNYQANSDDLAWVFGLFWDFWSLLVVCLFVILLFYFIKKLF